MSIITKVFGTYSDRQIKKITPVLKHVNALGDKYKAMSDADMRSQTDILKGRLAGGETLDDILPDAYACAREASDRILGKRPFDVQILGGILLHQGRITEMKTGEGKTIVAVLPSYLNALEGKGVHVVTVNEYLARLGCEEMGRIHEFLGLETGLIVHGQKRAEKQHAYNCDITYGTNNEFGFDYLRDNMVIYKEDRTQRGHNFAIVDEVDSILIDEARTPLIISGQGAEVDMLYDMADRFARTLRKYVIKELDTKEDNDDIDADYIVDEKAKSTTLTASGIAKAEKFFGIQNFSDPENADITHHIYQAIRAHGIMHLDTDYIVKDNEVIIVDAFTGRIMPGRRYSDGLHQAIEAKEGVKIQRENRTIATITFQNFFRMYHKLSGMTGTALSEENEFREIYNLDVVEVPTNRPMIRVDHPDVVYKTKAGKDRAIIRQIEECHAKGQPVLVGTVSIEKSEALSKKLKATGIPHTVLNAKFHDIEADIVAQAGKYGAVTISTNMAGRGTDIMLGGNAEYLAKAQMRKEEYPEEIIQSATGSAENVPEEVIEARKYFKELYKKYQETIQPEADKVREAGGLFVIGTERHESRRIDNQLRGRSGRQGDPGVSRFFLSTEDDLMRLFGGDRMRAMMERMNVDEDTAIENKMLTNIIESSQEKVELRNFGIRKDVLQYDDVLNRQREIIYGQRDQVLDGEDLHETVLKMLSDTIDTSIAHYLPEGPKENWNYPSLVEYYKDWIITDTEKYKLDLDDLEEMEADEIGQMIKDDALAIFAENEKIVPPETIREMERVYLLKSVDTHWMDHIDAMDQLKAGIRLRSYGQHDPVVEYRLEGFDMFDEMIENIREDTVKLMLIMPKRVYEIQKRQEAIEAARKAAQAAAAAAQQAAEKAAENASANAPEEKPQPTALQMAIKREQVAKPTMTSGDGTDTANKTIRKGKKVGRNDPCPCGSGKKYKKCCGRDK